MNCIPTEQLPTTVARILAEAGASKALLDRAVVIANDVQSITGQVVNVHTDKAVRSIMVAANPTTSVFFMFPANSATFETELIRAQDGGLRVQVQYRTDALGAKLIDSINVMAGIVSGNSPRY